MNKRLLLAFIIISVLIFAFSLKLPMMEAWGWYFGLLSFSLLGAPVVNVVVGLLLYFKDIETKKILIFYVAAMGISMLLIIFGIGALTLPIFLLSFCFYVLLYFINMGKYILALNFVLIALVAIQLLHINYAFMPELCMILLPILVVAFIVQLIPFIKETRNG